MNYKERINKIIKDNKMNSNVSEALNRMYEYLVNKQWWGACHACSSILYVVLTELGLDPKICVGEVKVNSTYFDHSWIEISNKVVDLAICMTLEQGNPASAPIIMNINVETNNNHDIDYGIYLQGLDNDAQVFYRSNFLDYMNNYPYRKNGLWDVVNDILENKIDIEKSKLKYKNVKKKYRR